MKRLLTSIALLAFPLGAMIAADAGIRVSDATLFGDMECFKIETPSATYLYGKVGAGFASIIDPDGHDWISYRHGGKALGEYRGLPKCGQPVKYFHCGYGFGQYATDNPFTSTVTLQEPAHVRVHSETKNGDAACDWDFFPTHATMTLAKIPGAFWFLYEGTPGGALDAAEDFAIRPGGRKKPLSEPWTDSVPWVCFGAKESPHGLLLVNHQPPETGQVDSCVAWPYQPDSDGALNQMTVFGFGRPGWQDPKQHTPPLQALPARYSIAVTRSSDAAVIEAALKDAKTIFPSVSALPAQAGLPDPLLMLDGRRVTTRVQWINERRPELLALFQHYMYGALPPRPQEVTGKVEREDRHAFGGKATLREVTLTIGPPEWPQINLMLIVPNQRQGPAPVVLGLNYFGNHTLVRDPAVCLSTNWMPERGEGVVNNRSTEASRGTWVDIWRIEYLLDRGYAVATFYNGDIDPDRPDERGIQTQFRKLDPGNDCGTVAAWAWGLQRAVDYLVTAPDVDRDRIIVTGHSRLGKAALVAAAFDERIAMAIPHQAGSGGSAPSRTAIQPAPAANAVVTGKPPETIKQLNDQFPHWCNARFKEFNDQPERLPFDQHCLVALCAPRPVLFTNGRQDTWINPSGQFEVLRAAAPVYRLLGAGDFSTTELPPDGELIGDALGYFLRPGAHSLTPEDWKAFLDFADQRLGLPSEPRFAATRVIKENVAALIDVPRWEMHEFTFQERRAVANPFSDGDLTGRFTAPSGKTVRVEGFYDGGKTWRLRFTPDEEGDWRYRVRGDPMGISVQGSLHCSAPKGHGFICLNPQNPYAFAYADGTPFFPMGDTCYGLYDDSHITPALRREYLETRRRQHFNFVRMSVGHSESRAAADPAFWAWGGTPDRPDLDRLNPVFFHGLDELFRDLQARGMNVELILLNFYRRPFTDPTLWTPARARLWLQYVEARYAAFNNVFLWTLANEYETQPDGRYRLDNPDDVMWAKSTAYQVKRFDAFHHPVTVHPVVSSSTQGTSPRDPIDSPWRIGGFFGEDRAMDVLSQQTGQWGEGVTWDDKLQCWTGDAPDLVASLRADRRFNKPVLNTENGYEYLHDQPTEKQQVHSTDKVRHSSWRIVCAGGYFAAGFHGTIGHSDAWNRIDATDRYTFIVRDEGAAAQLGILYDFLAALPFARMQPFDGVTGQAAVALAEPGRVYVVYLPQGGKVTVDLSAAQVPLTANWFNPRNGKSEEPFVVNPDKAVEFVAPDTGDWVLQVSVRAK